MFEHQINNKLRNSMFVQIVELLEQKTLTC